MTKPTLTPPNYKAAWAKELRAGDEGSIWRIGAEIVDDEMKSARKLLRQSGMPYAACDLVRLAGVLFRSASLPSGIVALAKARLDCDGMPYGASDLVEMIALFIECMDALAEDRADHMQNCPDCSGQVRH